MMENKGSFSFINYIDSEFRRGYHLEYDREKFASRREKIYAFFKIPCELEKLIIFGYFHCADSFLFVITFLPVRFAWAFLKLLYKCFTLLFRKEQQSFRNMETIDLIKGFLIITCCFISTYVDTSMFYHLIKTQSAVKLYIFYNMLDIADKLMSAFGQDTLDALFWTATAPKDRKRGYFLLVFHLAVSVFYISLHSGIVLLQALVLNVAVNSESKGLLTIVISNNFIEIKGSVFKKYDRNNLLQITCSDVRERFHHGVLIFVVVMLTMKEYSWREDQLFDMLMVCGVIFLVEMFIDWLKHAFITRFNEIPIEVYNDYMLLLSSDLVMCKKQNAFSDHSDLVARRMGFTPLPLGVIVFRILSQTLKFNNMFSVFLLFFGYLCLFSFRILISILILTAASYCINAARTTRKATVSECERKDAAWRNAVDSYCERVNAPQRIRRGTVSREDTLLDIPIESSRTVSKDDIMDIHSKSEEFQTAVDRFSELSVPTGDCNYSDEDASGGSEASLGFLGESRAGLLSNSMINLVGVGLDTPESGSDDEPTANTDLVGGALNHLPQPTEIVRATDAKESRDQTEVIECEILPILRKGVLVSDASHENILPIDSTTDHF